MAPSKTPYRQIRAVYDGKSITVYQAYSNSIGKAAVKHQKLNVSPDFKLMRMTWIKPSWTWMMYRCGYSYKDDCQNCVLAIKVSHEGFVKLLENAKLSTHGQGGQEGKQGGKGKVVVQWDPERSWRNGKMEDVRSIQVGIGADMVEKWIEEWVVGVEDVTEKARELKKALDGEKDITEDDLRKRGLLPEEKEYMVPEHVMRILKM